MKLPAAGLPRDEVLARLEAYRADDLAARGGRAFGYVFDPGEAAYDELAHQVYADFLDVNGLDPTVFPSVLRMENDVVGIAAEHLGGDAETVGTFTSGGTESIILAVKAARDHARTHRPEVTDPELVLPVTAHAAFHKAAHYLGLRKVLVPVDPETFRADAAAMAAAITGNTVLLVASAASYAHGVIDPIEEIGAVAAERGLPFHVDGCMGGWLLPFFRRLGADVPPFDLSVPGVTSISVDLHKYAYAPKGASVVLFRDQRLRRAHYFAAADWTGYTVVNAAVQSTKSGGPVAAAWALLHHVGDAGYLELARRSLDATRRIVGGVAEIPGLRVLGEPKMSLVALASADPEVDVFSVCDAMNAQGWYLQPQLGYRGMPGSIHLTVTAANEAQVDALLADLAACVEKTRGQVTTLDPEVRAAVADLDVAALPPDALATLLPLAGLEPGGGLPEQMAPINALLEAMPPALRERLLIEYLAMLFTPTREAQA